MVLIMNRKLKKQQIENKIESYLEDLYFDVSSIPFSPYTPLTEAHLSKILTKIAVGSATVLWSFVELKDYFYNRKLYRERFRR
jgi:hypothetical protein